MNLSSVGLNQNKVNDLEGNGYFKGLFKILGEKENKLEY